MEERQTTTQPDRDVMAMLLTTNVQMVAEVLRAEDDHTPHQVIRAIAATRSLATIVEDTLRALVDQARSTGHTWAEIGDVLHVTRQAAFQRFGSARTAADDTRDAQPIAGAIDQALPILQMFLDERFAEMRETFDQRMLDACPVELLQQVRDKVSNEAGPVQELGTPILSVQEGYTVVDIPVACERQDAVGRVVLNADGQVSGFFIRPAE